ncbi:HET domain protein [Xylogone sp. PMI_703]|nr:HET domain protein [Xylogone sp. PMI_703]
MSETEASCTTTDNINERREGGVSWLRDLPKIFLDTFVLARRLGIKYVWIDSLCIIQRGDNGADWLEESIKMADYFQHALLTIAATSGSRDGGLIPPKVTSPPRIARLPYRDDRGSQRGFFYVYYYDREVDRQYQSFIQQSELLTRGWVFQEWLLSRRIVYFTPAGAFFECQESKPVNERGEVSPNWTENDSEATLQQMGKNAFLFKAASINSLWYQIVESYSALSLSRPECDRLVALTGVAKEFREAMERTPSSPVNATVNCGPEWVAGIWLRDLHRGLLWEQKFGSDCNRLPLAQFPTWSWASILCPVFWNNLHDARVQPKARVIAVTTSKDETFPVESLRHTTGLVLPLLESGFDVNDRFACLYMRGKALQVIVRERMDDEHDLEITSEISGCGRSVRNAWRIVCSSLRPTEIAGWASFEHSDYQDDLAFEQGAAVYAFHVSTTSRVPGGFGLGYLTPWHDVFNVLFIRNTEGIKYERIGVGKLFGREFEGQLNTASFQDVELI